jgi:acetyl esterase/lipase
MISFIFEKLIFRKKTKALTIFLFFLLINSMSSAQKIISLYESIPGSKTAIDYVEKADTGADGVIRISKVYVPQIEIFKPAKTASETPAVIICPGGGYAILAYNLEGTTVAHILNNWGVTAIVLKYRLPSDEIMEDKSIGPLQDAQRAIQYVRENARQLNIDPQKIGIMGFSAGGHLASTASTHFNTEYISNPKHISLRHDFSILGYHVISMIDSVTHKGSRNNLLGTRPSPEMVNNFSNELQVSGNTPPTFLVLASDDNGVEPRNSISYYEALLKHHVPAELHIYQNGGHGFGTLILEKNDNWMDLLRVWMYHNGILK